MKKLVLALVASSALFAVDSAYNYEITPTFGGVHSEGNLDLNRNSATVGLRVARNLEDFFLDQLELGFDNAPRTREIIDGVSKKGDATRYFINGVKNIFDLGDSVGVYGFIGAGYEDLPKSFVRNEDGGFGHYGLGLRYQITDAFALKAEVRDQIKFEHADHNLFYTLGLAFGLGKKAVSAPVSTPAPVVEPVKVMQEVAPVVLDDDKDGVLNDADLCPNTPAGVVVDEKGCEKKIVLKDVNFAFDSFEVSAGYAQRIKEVADFMQANPVYNVKLSGYTDSVGSEAYNLKLSDKRAKAVKSELVKNGVSSDKITTIGYGEANPVATNKTKEGRAENRRVEATFNK